MSNSLDEQPKFYENWQINYEKLEALHQSGVKFTLLNRDEKGEIAVKFTAPKNWIADQRKMFPNRKIEDILASLKKEFGIIMRNTPIPEPIKPLELLAQIKNKRIRGI